MRGRGRSIRVPVSSDSFSSRPRTISRSVSRLQRSSTLTCSGDRRAAMADTARDTHLKEPVASFLVVFTDFGVRAEAVRASSACLTRSPTARDACCCAPAKSSTNFALSGPGGGTTRQQSYPSSSLCPFRLENSGRDSPVTPRQRTSCGCRRSRRTWGASIHDAAPATTARPPGGAFGPTFSVCEPCHGLSEGARD
jgi:hypothetical protein